VPNGFVHVVVPKFAGVGAGCGMIAKSVRSQVMFIVFAARAVTLPPAGATVVRAATLSAATNADRLSSRSLRRGRGCTRVPLDTERCRRASSLNASGHVSGHAAAPDP
jgi:hypothetical protein